MDREAIGPEFLFKDRIKTSCYEKMKGAIEQNKENTISDFIWLIYDGRS